MSNLSVMQQILERIKAYDHIMLFRHVRMDGDCAGATKGLKALILASFPEKTVQIIDDQHSDYLDFMGVDDAPVGDDAYADALGIVIDTASVKRISNQKYALCKELIKIDHHIDVEQYGDTFIVTYTTTDAIHESLTGTYAVIVTDGKSSAYWTHDDLDPALWQTGSLTSPAWGVKQLQAYLDAGPAGRNGFCLPYLSDEAIANDDPAELARLWQDEYVYPLVTADGTEAMDSTKARALSKAALINAYSLTEAEMNSAAFLWCDLYLRPNGSLMWEVGYYLDADEEYNFYVTLDAVTGEILSLSHGTGGIG